jgi:calmodulin
MNPSPPDQPSSSNREDNPNAANRKLNASATKEEAQEIPDSVKDKLSEEDIESFRVAFTALDKDGSGNIDLPELSDMLGNLGFKTSMADMQEMFTEVDTDGSGEINFIEFLEMMAKKMEGQDLDSEAALKEVFQLFDEDGGGTIDLKEFKHLLTTLGTGLSNEECKEIIQIVDVDGDGEIDFQEFLKAMTDKDSKLAQFRSRIRLVQNVTQITRRHVGAWIGKGARGSWSCCGGKNSNSAGCPMHSGEWEGHYWSCCYNRSEDTTFCKIEAQVITPSAVIEAKPGKYLSAIEKAKLAEQEAADSEVRATEEAAIEEEMRRATVRNKVSSNLWDKQSSQPEDGGDHGNDDDGDMNWIEAEEAEKAAKAAAKLEAEKEGQKKKRQTLRLRGI